MASQTYNTGPVDLAIVGGGLAGGLIALAVHRARPDMSLMLIEAGVSLGGNHRWSWFESDLEPATAALLDCFQQARWDGGYDIGFVGHARHLGSAYRSVASADFDAALRRLLPSQSIRTSARVSNLGQGGVSLATGERLPARAVIDCRDFAPSQHLTGGWQLFVGHHIRTREPHGLSAPIIMDADVAQHGAYRFVYSLPLAEDEIFVEDTYYANSPALDRARLAQRIESYTADRGWEGAVIATEAGVLPVITGGDGAAHRKLMATPGVALAGARGLFSHPLTSYTLPFAAANALAIATAAHLPGPDLAALMERRAAEHWRRTRFYRDLGRMLFLAAAPDERWRIFARFYRLPEPLIERFYAGRSTALDKLRVLSGKPPVPLGRGLAALLGKGAALVQGVGVTPTIAPEPVSAATPALAGRSACVIGAGFGGLALAIRLQAAGVATTLIEGRDKPGGRAYFWERDGFTFDAGPTVITDPACLKELWALSGHDMAADIELMPVMPFYRLAWPDGTQFDYSNDERALNAEIARLNPVDVAGYERFLAYSAEVYREGYVKLGHVPFLDFASMVKAAPAMLKSQAWRSVYSMVSHFVEDERLRQALSFHTLLVGGNPMTTSAIYALIHKLEKDGGVWWAKGGTNRLVAAMVTHFERLGGTVRLSDPVKQVHTFGTRASEVETASGWRQRFDAVASNADVMHSYKALLSSSKRGVDYSAKLARKRFSPSLFVVHFGIEGTWPGIPHHMILFGPRYRELLEDIYDRGVLPEDFSIYLHHPTVTDPSMAPEGKSTFYALVPVAHLGKLAIDWEQMGPVLEKRILDEIGRRLIPDIHDRLITKFHYTPRDFHADLNAHVGSAFSLEPILTQSAYFRGHNRDDVLSNFYLVGAGTHPGAGIPGVVGSAKATAGLMLEDLGK